MTKGKEQGRRRASWRSIVGGDILAADFLRRQMRLLVLLMTLILFYIHNRYACQQKMLEMDALKRKLTDMRYDALTRSSELTERSRQSRIELYVTQRQSSLQTATQPPYLIGEE